MICRSGQSVNLLVRSRKFGLQGDCELREVDEFGLVKGPGSGLAVVGKSEKEVEGVFGDFRSFSSGFEVEGPQG